MSHTFEANRDKTRNLWWVQAMLLGVVFGVVTGLFAAHRHHDSDVADGLVTGAIGGAFFGLVMGWVTRRQQVPAIGEPPLSLPVWVSIRPCRAARRLRAAVLRCRPAAVSDCHSSATAPPTKV